MPGGQRGPSQEHAKQHGLAIGQRQLDRPFAPREREPREDDEALLTVPPRIAHPAPIDDGGLAMNDDVVAPLQRVHPESHMVDAATPKGVDIEGVEGRGPGPGIDLGLDQRDPQIG